jgi:riboflavin kinase/FMN adenylyltransferase
VGNRIIFTGRVIKGSGRGKELGIPTLNLDLKDIPEELKEGIYAVWVIDHTAKSQITNLKSQNDLPAVMHYGERPVFKDTKSCEVHFLQGQEMRSDERNTLNVHVVERIRDVQDFDNAEALKRQIASDIRKAKEILTNKPVKLPGLKARASLMPKRNPAPKAP